MYVEFPSQRSIKRDRNFVDISLHIEDTGFQRFVNLKMLLSYAEFHFHTIVKTTHNM